ncbi:uncharacterized protein LOC144920702 [Branchiostoma floridae x Branchiostoma belcheri]
MFNYEVMAAKKPTFKLVLLGEVGVGKTSLFLRLKDGTFLEDAHASIGVDCCETAVSVEGEEVRIPLGGKKTVSNWPGSIHWSEKLRGHRRLVGIRKKKTAIYKKVTIIPPQPLLGEHLCVWDTAGVERFRTLTQGYYRHADAVLLQLLCVWDTAGVERFRTLTQGYYRHADALCVWDTAGVERFRTLTQGYYRHADTQAGVLLLPYCSLQLLCVWDTAGVERFRTLTQGYYRHADAVLLVYSLPDSATLRMLTSWVREVNDRTVMSNTPVLKIIVGNKSDLEHRTSEQAAAELAAAFGCELVLQVSARTGEGMEEALQVIAGKLLARSRERKRSHLASPASDDVSPLTLGRRDTTERRNTSRCC